MMTMQYIWRFVAEMEDSSEVVLNPDADYIGSYWDAVIKSDALSADMDGVERITMERRGEAGLEAKRATPTAID